MEKFGGMKFRSVWDWSSWLIVAIVAACCVIPCFLDDGFWPSIISMVMLIFVVIAFLSIHYRIDGDKLIVYSFFRPSVYPISRIKEIKPTKSALSSPASSLTRRLAITFTDRCVLKSSDPLIISPMRQDEFITRILSVNPGIRVDR